MSRKFEAREARLQGLTRFVPTALVGCQKHPQAEHYTANAACCECQEERKKGQESYWSKNREELNAKKREKYLQDKIQIPRVRGML